ncbi:hypothetical protein M501DRAFT_997547 [Patellaria atrata CBS 101060]|uniref:Uncharacterized protein n=1 Tax=Patellaria atrata CBS 101060 TaxID=1346257 RepID=A0A9P4S6C2_9PEZI|nr:hypothetical protein M501DRAFT_997547 [Patellaria atrata CBS 101060]
MLNHPRILNPHQRRQIQEQQRLNQQRYEEEHRVDHPSEKMGTSASKPGEPYIPTPKDQHAVRLLLHLRCKLPLELADIIITTAEYFPKLSCQNDKGVIASASSGVGNSLRHLYLVSNPIPEPQPGEKLRVRKIKFYTNSHDQGWCDNEPSRKNKYDSSFTWFEVSIFRPIKEPPPQTITANRIPDVNDFVHPLHDQGWEIVKNGDTPVWHLQRNLCANENFIDHTVTWYEDGTKDFERSGYEENEVHETGDGTGDGKDFIKSLRSGDRIGIWVCAQFPGWANTVNDIKMEMTYTA